MFVEITIKRVIDIQYNGGLVCGNRCKYLAANEEGQFTYCELFGNRLIEKGNGYNRCDDCVAATLKGIASTR